MKKFVRYLYEYQNGTRVQNVGFVKVEETDVLTRIQIYGKGFPASVSQKLEIFLFYLQDEKCIGIPMGMLNGLRPMTPHNIEYRTEEQSVEGIAIKGAKWYGATWDGEKADIENLIVRENETEPSEPLAEEDAETEEIVAEEIEEEPVFESADKVYKITRKDLVMLPREEWKLANNHFLMHGCRNFHHLISFEKDGAYWLGVPGIFHQQEQRAAQAFGFEEFMKPEEGDIILDEEEQTEHGEFGYWCRKVNNIIKGRE